MASFGQTLKRERESRNISLREIAETTKINIRHLEALEADHFTALPGGVFNRGFVRAYADYLGIDADGAVRDFLAAVDAAGVQSSEGALPHADRIAPKARITMGPDPRQEASTGGENGGNVRAPGSRRLMAIAFWAVIGGALIAGPLFMRGERRPAPPATSDARDAQSAAEPSAEQEAFEPPEGMFVDAGPAVPEEEEAPGSGTPPATGAPSEAMRGQRPSRPQSAMAGIGNASTSAPRPPPAAEPKREEASLPAIPPADAAPPPTRAPGPLALEVEVTRETWLWLACDSKTRIDRRVRPGEAITMQCLRSIRVSAHDAGAVRLRVNGAGCMPLGDDGASVYGYTIRFDDAHLICRSPRSD